MGRLGCWRSKGADAILVSIQGARTHLKVEDPLHQIAEGAQVQRRTLTLQVPPDAAKAYEMASPEERHRVDEALRRRLRELMKGLPRTGGAAAAREQAEGAQPSPGIHPEVRKMSGLVPPEVDARAEYREYLSKKHR